MAAPGLNCSMQTLSCDTWDWVPRPGIKPGPPVLGAWSRNHWTTREVPAWCFFNMSCSRKKKTTPFWPLGYEHMSKFTCPRALPSQTPVKKHSLKGFWLPWLSSEQWLLSQLGLGSPEWIWVGVCPGTAPGLVCTWTASLHSLGTHQCMPCDTCSGDPDSLSGVSPSAVSSQAASACLGFFAKDGGQILLPGTFSPFILLHPESHRPPPPSPTPVGCCCLLVQAAV